MQINYKKIGKRIKSQRKMRNMTQEVLAEYCNISAPHMSNIENGNTKVSLPVLIKIANSLNCTVDQLLCDNLDNMQASTKQIDNILSDCTPDQRSIIIDMVYSLKSSLSKLK